MDSTPGQRLLASLVDVAFFILIGVLTLHGKLTEQAVLPILILYARERFAAQQTKTIMALGSGGGAGPSNRPPPGTGVSGQMPAVSAPTSDRGFRTETTPVEVPRPGPRKDPRRDDRLAQPAGILEIVRGYVKTPTAIAVTAVLVFVSTAHGCAYRPAAIVTVAK